MFSVLAVLIVQLRHVVADRRDLLLENAALRQQLAVYQRNGNRPKLTSADRLFWVWLSRSWPGWPEPALGEHDSCRFSPEAG